MPMPESATEMVIAVSDSCPSSTTSPPTEVNFTALSSRCPSTSRSRTGSAVTGGSAATSTGQRSFTPSRCALGCTTSIASVKTSPNATCSVLTCKRPRSRSAKLSRLEMRFICRSPAAMSSSTNSRWPASSPVAVRS